MWDSETGSPLRPPSTSVPPNLADEVVSRADSGDYIVDKVAEYFRAGVERVWVIFPSQEQVYAYDSPIIARILKRTDELSGDPILPHFRLPLVELSEEMESLRGLERFHISLWQDRTRKHPACLHLALAPPSPGGHRHRIQQ